VDQANRSVEPDTSPAAATTALLSKNSMFGASIRKVSFRPREDMYLLLVVVDADAADFGPLWLIPSYEFDKRVKANAKGLMPFRASVKAESKDQWSQYRLNKLDLPSKLLAILGEV